MRIIAGIHKGRTLRSPTWPGLRPTSDRLRETLFNILAPRIPGARVLDLYAGTGAVALEALSRGAAHAVCVESNRRARTLIEQNRAHLGEDARCMIVGDGAEYALRAPIPGGPFDIVFLDPPFASTLLQQACDMLAAGWLAPGAQIYVENPADEPLPKFPAGWVVHRTKQAGQVGYHLLRNGAATREDPS